ncbi:MAG: HAD hydrolase-like protein [Calothrix sp. MO_192.B10]|nr:HAD hydrolase-like protein [Calothrix sp. MO_192.B10]
MKKAIFFDIDKTLTTTISGEALKKDENDIKLIEGVEEGTEYFKLKGYKLFGVSNQGGCSAVNKATGLPFKSISRAIKEMQNTHILLPQLELIAFCPDFEGNIIYEVQQGEYRHFYRNELLHPNSSSANTLLFPSFRKPSPGMINKIIWDWNLHDADEIWMIGDRKEDEEVAEAANIKFMWAEKFHKRFRSGLQEIGEITSEQLQLLENLRL